MRHVLLSAAIALLLPFLTARAEPLAVGAATPRLTVPDQEGHPFDLGEALAKGWTLVYFYPKAGTPGCTAEACSLRDSFAALRAQGIAVVGVSLDAVAEQKKFQDHYNLPFPLLSDPERMVAQAFGVPPKAGGLGLDERQSFLVHDGAVAWRQLEGTTETQGADVLAAYEALNPPAK